MRLVWTLFTHAACRFLSCLTLLVITCNLAGTAANAAVIEATTLPPSAPPPAGAKFLLVVDTSAAMNQFEHSGRQVVFDLIYTGISNQMQNADTFGVWTFSEQVNAGGFPMQFWTSAKSLELASQTGVFLKNERYKGKARLELAIAKALTLVKTVKDVNVLIVTSGEASLGMSELEVKLRDAYQRKGQQAREKNLPVVLAFSSTEGEIAMAGVTLAGEKVPLREDLLAKARVPLAKPTNEVAKAAAPPPIPVRPKPIIMIGQPKATASAVPAATVADASVGESNKTTPVLPLSATAATDASSDASSAPAAVPVQNVSLPLAAETKTHPSATEPARTEGASPLKTAPATVGSKTMPELIPSPIKVAAREPQQVQEPSAIAPVVAATVVPQAPSDGRWVLFVGVGFFALSLALCAWVVLKLRTRETTFISRSMSARHPGNH